MTRPELMNKYTKLLNSAMRYKVDRGHGGEIYAVLDKKLVRTYLGNLYNEAYRHGYKDHKKDFLKKEMP